MTVADPIPWVGTPSTPPALEWQGAGAVTTAPAPPLADGGWNDAALTLDHVLDQLRLDPTDPDAPEVTAAMYAAVAMIDQYLDRVDPLPGPPPPAPVQLALEIQTIENYRRKDAPFAMLNTTLPDQDVPTDIGGVGMLQSVAGLLQPYRQRWGFA